MVKHKRNADDGDGNGNGNGAKSLMPCPKCGTMVAKTAPQCGWCGRRLRRTR
ncbi:MAG: zinc-ribbon domain-containing protein [Anaerovoracaceae bacterium]